MLSLSSHVSLASSWNPSKRRLFRRLRSSKSASFFIVFVTKSSVISTSLISSTLLSMSLTRALCSWPSCRGSLDWLVIRGVLLGRRCHLLLFAWCLLWWFFFFLWRSCWSSLQNSTSSHFLQDQFLPLFWYYKPILRPCFLNQMWWSYVSPHLFFLRIFCKSSYIKSSHAEFSLPLDVYRSSFHP